VYFPGGQKIKNIGKYNQGFPFVVLPVVELYFPWLGCTSRWSKVVFPGVFFFENPGKYNKKMKKTREVQLFFKKTPGSTFNPLFIYLDLIFDLI